MLAWLRGLHLPKLQPLLSAPASGAPSLSEACATALPYLAVADYLQPRTVAWEQIHPAPCAKVWQRAANCAQAVKVLEQRGFRDAVSVVRPGELAINVVPARARGLLWLLMRQAIPGRYRHPCPWCTALALPTLPLPGDAPPRGLRARRRRLGIFFAGQRHCAKRA